MRLIIGYISNTTTDNIKQTVEYNEDATNVQVHNNDPVQSDHVPPIVPGEQERIPIDEANRWDRSNASGNPGNHRYASSHYWRQMRADAILMAASRGQSSKPAPERSLKEMAELQQREYEARYRILREMGFSQPEHELRDVIKHCFGDIGQVIDHLSRRCH